MADKSDIEWTDATWNPVTGCSVVSPGCTNCYAMRLAGTRLQHHPSRAGLTVDSKAGPVWNGKVTFNEGWLDQPLRWSKPRRIFVCAHGDLFHEAIPDAWIDRVFAVMALAGRHTFQVLTKRPERMRAYFAGLAADSEARGDDHTICPARLEQAAVDVSNSPCAGGALEDIAWPLPNVWLGVSAEDQARADARIADLLLTPAVVHFLSAEPLLGPINLRELAFTPDFLDALSGRPVFYSEPGWKLPRLDWVIVGGESGPGARPMHPDWARQIRDACAAAGVDFFFKQWGVHLWAERVAGDPSTLTAYRAGKHDIRTLDGVLHDAMPPSFNSEVYLANA